MTRELSVDFGKFGQPGLMRFLGGRKSLAPNISGVLPNPHLPAFMISAPTYTNESRCIATALLSIAGIFAAVSRAKVGYPIIIAHAIDMVNFILRPFSIVMEPRETVGIVFAWELDSNSKMAFYSSSGNSSDKFCIPFLRMIRSVFPSENPGSWIIIKNRANEICRVIGLSFNRHAFLHNLWQPLTIPWAPLSCKRSI